MGVEAARLRQHPQLCVAHIGLPPQLGVFVTERDPIGGDPQNRRHLRPQRADELFDAFPACFQFGTTQLAGLGSGTVHEISDPDSPIRQHLLVARRQTGARVNLPRRQPGSSKRRPKTIPRIGKGGIDRRRPQPWINSHHQQSRRARQHIVDALTGELRQLLTPGAHPTHGRNSHCPIVPLPRQYLCATVRPVRVTSSPQDDAVLEIPVSETIARRMRPKLGTMEGMQTITPETLPSVLPHKLGAPRIVVSGNGGVPWTLLRLVDEAIPEYRLHMLNAPKGLPDRDGVTLETTFVGPGMRRSPRLSYYPCRLSRVPVLFKNRLPVDIVLVHVSAPVNGKVSMGVAVDIMPAAIESARMNGGFVIAQVNPQMPYTYGDGEMELDAFDAVLEVDEPLVTLPKPAGRDNANTAANGAAESARIIGSLVSNRVADGGTLQLGIGEIPDATLAGLKAKKNLGIWTEMISDGILELQQAGALDPDRKLVSSFVLGSADVYNYLHLNDDVRILRTETTNSVGQIARNPGMTSINTALQVDLYDQANASRIGNRIFSGFGGQTDFTVGAVHAPGGQALMALRSWHPKADVSTIVPVLTTPVTSFQHTAVITENGVAEVGGCSQSDQARHIINYAAHSQVRDELREYAETHNVIANS